MSNEKLRLEAELKDNMSPGLRKIKAEINSIRVSPGMQAATGWFTKLGKEAKDFTLSGGGAAGVMGAIGIGGLAAAASLAEVTAQMKSLGDKAIAMKELGRETGVSTNYLNAFSHAGLSFGVSTDSMQSALNHLSSQMPQFRRNFGALHNLMAQRWPNLTAKLMIDTPEQQIKDIFQEFDKLKNEPQLQKQLLDQAFGNGSDMEKLMRNGAAGFFKEFDKQKHLLNPINPEFIKQSQALRDSIIGLNDALENFENKAGPTFLKMLRSVVRASNDVVSHPTSFIAPNIVTDLKHIGRDVGEVPNPLSERYDPSKQVHVKDATTLAPLNQAGTVDLQRAKQRLEEYDKANPGGGSGRKALQNEVDFYSKLLHKSSFRGPDSRSAPGAHDYHGLLHNTAFVTNGRSGLMGGMSGLEGVIASGTKIGFLAAFRELMVDQSVGADSASGFTKASYEPGNSAIAAGRSIGRAERGGDLLGPNEPTGAAHLRVSKGMAANAKETYEFWRKQGFSRNAALGFVGNEQGEGTLARGAATGRGRWGLHWDLKHNSGGIVQWDPARRADIMKHTGIDVWGKSTSHADQLLAEEWEMKHRYPKLWEQLRRDKISIGQATHGLVHTYERPADPGGQSRLRGSYGEGWAKRLDDGPPRKATGLSDSHDSAGKVPAGVGGHLQVDINDRSSTHNVTIQSRGGMKTNLRRWPKLDSAGLNV